ncbi:thioesterase domain-containing protein [Actinomadura sp. 6K520]|uniref:thioesterase II family protein n=1 Tax=Actinomadura sp. 6K520 TaxID=2530364 RepID=UPI00104CC086|nr:thioesterase domain-containing protein [Actinomadura sp. 6K520]TDE32818.1 thioesterase [Actinomadura sp. 6K520]
MKVTSPPRVNRQRWLSRKPDPSAAARLFCFPYSGCSASMYSQWPRWIGQIEICLIQPPARQKRIREPHYETYEALAAALVEYLPPYLDRPFAFFGHCGGALPGVELTRQLAAAGLPLPRRVFVSSQVAPHDGPYGRLLDLNADQLGEELGKIMTNLGVEPTAELIEMSLELLIQDLEANKRYKVAKPFYLPTGITAIGWYDDSEIPMDRMNGWREVSEDCRYALLEGDHFRFLDAPRALLDEFERDLASSA